MRILAGIFGAFVMVISAMFVVMAIGDLIFGSKTQTSVLLGLLVFFGGTAVGGAFLTRFGFRKQRASSEISDFEKEQRILGYAAAMGGLVTVANVSLSCRLSLAESQQMLDTMAHTGAAEMRVNDDGSFVYLFRSFLPANAPNHLSGQPVAHPTQPPQFETTRELQAPPRPPEMYER